MSMFGPIYSPADVANTAATNPESAIGKMVVNAGVEAIQKALEPPTEQEKQQAQQAEAKKAQEERDRQQADDARRQADRLRVMLEQDPNAVTLGKADALKAADQIDTNTGAGFDDVELALAGKRLEVLTEIDRMRTGASGKLDMNISGLDGFIPEVPGLVLERAGVIRLSLDDRNQGGLVNPFNEEQTFERGESIRQLANGEMRVRVRLDYADGSITHTEMNFRKEEAELAQGDESSRVLGKIGPANRLAAAA